MASSASSTDVFLVSEYTTTYRLKKIQKNTIGRDDDNNIVLKNLLVSRHHAEILWENRGFVIHDLNSQNGTIVNDKTIQKVALQHGDVIKIGGFEFIVQFSSYQDIMRILTEEKGRAANKKTMKVLGGDLEFSPNKTKGSLDTIRLIEFIQMLHQSQKTGLLTLKKDDTSTESGNIFFERGDIVHSYMGSEQGIPVLMNLLRWTSGIFEFKDNVHAPERTILQSVDWILLKSSPEDD